MLEAFRIIINGVWAILCITIPISSKTYTYVDQYTGITKTAPSISFTLWQYFLFMIIVGIMIRLIIGQVVKKGD